MQEVVLTKAYTLQWRDVPVPVLAPDQVLLRIQRMGICASDMQMYHGLHRYMTYPVVPGHEASAVVESVGVNAQGVAVGDLVSIQPQVNCGHCYPCEIGRANVCENLEVMGVHRDGFAREYVAIRPEFLHVCPPGMTPDLAVLAEPLAVGIGSVQRARQLKGANVVVVGAGTIGNLVAQSAQALGAGHVMVTDINPKKLAYAEKTGIEHCINTSDFSLKDAVDQVFGKRKADIIIDCAATAGSFASILDASRPSSQIILTGNYKQPLEVELPRIQRREIELTGHMMYLREDYALAIQLLAEKKINVDGFITQHFAFEQMQSAFDFVDANPSDVMKAVIDIHSQQT